MKTLSWFLQFFYVPFTAQIRPVRRTAALGFQGECMFRRWVKTGEKTKVYLSDRFITVAAGERSPLPLTSLRSVAFSVPSRSVPFRELH